MEPTLAAVAVVLAACAHLAAADNQCAQVPYVKGVDQSPAPVWSSGKCTSAIEQSFSRSHWCSAGPIGLWPSPPTAKSEKCLKFARATIFRGPIYGSSPQQFAACNKRLRGSDDYAMVALSTKYLKTYQGGWAGDKGACDKCMCVRMHGADTNYNKGVQRDVVGKHLGLTFAAQVGDRCSECDDDHLDILQDRPFSFAPFNPASDNENYNAPYANAKDGLRGIKDPASMRPGAASPETAGTYTVQWQFVPCGTTHEQCGQMMRNMGYANVWAPSRVGGVDSWSLRPIAQLREGGANAARLFKEPWT